MLKRAMAYRAAVEGSNDRYRSGPAKQVPMKKTKMLEPSTACFPAENALSSIEASQRLVLSICSYNALGGGLNLDGHSRAWCGQLQGTISLLLGGQTKLTRRI